MKRLLILTLALGLASTLGFAQMNPNRDRDRDRDVDQVNIQATPQVTPTTNSATITWQTNTNAATDVWLEGGSINGHRNEFERGGSRNHSVSFNNLQPNTTYTYMIRSREGQVRYQGTFTTK